jgi:site-specific DNA-cytosine methylase
MKHATIIPLIGGEVLASDEVWNNTPEYILTYSPFADNESHLRNYYKNVKGVDVPYLQLDKGDVAPYPVDIISSVCPCAGLSQYHSKAGEDNQNNQWMEKTAKYILGEVKPKVFWGENAPGLVGKIGEFMLKKLRQIGLENGYGMSLFLTKNILHGIPQFRKRTFYFFWRKDVFGEKTPIFNTYARPYVKIEDLIDGVTSNFQQEPINKKIPSKDDPYYRYLLEVVHGGISHREYFNLLETKNVRGNDIEHLVEQSPGHDYRTVGAWMKENGYDREVDKCERKFLKLAGGGNIMRRGTIVPKDYIGAFVGHYPNVLTHPYEDRYITYREAMTIMGLPSDYELLNPEKSVNHICQNVPFQTAKDMATEIKAVFEGERTMIDTDFLFQNNYNGSYENLNKKQNNLEEFFS